LNNNDNIVANFVLNAVNPGSGFSQSNRPPATWYPYPSNSFFLQKLPSDAASHDIVPANYGLAASSEAAMVNCALTGCGSTSLTDPLGAMRVFITSAASNGLPSSNDEDKPINYSKPSDPYYKVSYDGNTCFYEPNNSYIFQAPSGAPFASNGGSTDAHLSGLDQSQGIFWTLGRTGSGNTNGLDPCPGPGGHPAGTPTDPCSANDLGASSCSAERIGVNKDWGWNGSSTETFTSLGVTQHTGGPGDNIDFSAVGGSNPVRFEELGIDVHSVLGAILRIATSGIGCTTGFVYPADGAAHACTGGQPTPNNWPPNGALLHCDYTPAQIASMKLPQWQNLMLTWMCGYGTFPTVTNNTTAGVWPLSDENVESELPYFLAIGQHHPIFAWLQGQALGSPNCHGAGTDCPLPTTINCGGSNPPPQSAYRCSQNMLYGIPPVPGDVVSPNEGYVFQHFHIADPCLIKRMLNTVGANVAGAC
jgi:hypothetical protein